MLGLYSKYTVTKNSGDQDPEADYFVLRLDKDPHARIAAKAYADSIKDENPNLAFEIREQVAKYEGGLINGNS